MIDVLDLTNRFGPPDGGLLAVAQVSFQVSSGEIFGFLGLPPTVASPGPVAAFQSPLSHHKGAHHAYPD